MGGLITQLRAYICSSAYLSIVDTMRATGWQGNDQCVNIEVVRVGQENQGARCVISFHLIFFCVRPVVQSFLCTFVSARNCIVQGGRNRRDIWDLEIGYLGIWEPTTDLGIRCLIASFQGQNLDEFNYSSSRRPRRM